MVGSAILHRLQARGDTEIVTATHVEFDLTNQAALLRRQGHEVPPSREGGR